MNALFEFFCGETVRQKLEPYGAPADWTFVLNTPRFKASSHLIFFVVDRRTRQPVLVAKVPRVPGKTARLEREARNLSFVQTSRPHGFDSVPRVVAFEDYCGQRFLVQTALPYETLRPAVVRQKPGFYTHLVLDWLVQLQRATRKAPRREHTAGLVHAMLSQLERGLPGRSAEQQLIQETRERLSPLGQTELPTVCEHGDLSSPNILIGPDAALGVVDWELAEPKGLPAVDAFFFLTYVAFARRRARHIREYLTAFHEAFWGSAWTRPFLARYRQALKLPEPVLKPLFLACWTRYVAGLVARLRGGAPADTPLSTEDLRWLRTNRYYALWNHTLTHYQALRF